MIDDRIYKGKALLYEGIEFNEEVIFYCNDVGTSAIVLEFYKDLKTPYSLEGARVAVNIAKKDGNIVTDFMNITGENKAEYIYPINGLTAVGKSNCTILVYDGNGDRVTFGTFKFRVRADINGDIESTTEYPVLNKLISDVDVLNQDVNSAEALRIVEENHRKSNEVERKNNENDRVKTFNDIKNEYSSIKGIMIDENNAANLQNQINKTNSDLDNYTNKNEWFLSTKEFNIEDGLTDNNYKDQSFGIQLLINTCSENKINTINFRKARYYIANTIFIPENCIVNFNGSTLVPIEGGTFEDGFMFKINGSDITNIQKTYARLNNKILDIRIDNIFYLNVKSIFVGSSTEIVNLTTNNMYSTIDICDRYIDQMRLDNIIIQNHQGDDYAITQIVGRYGGNITSTRGDTWEFNQLHIIGTNLKLLHMNGTNSGVNIKNVINGFLMLENGDFHLDNMYIEDGNIFIKNGMVDIRNSILYQDTNNKYPVTIMANGDKSRNVILDNIKFSYKSWRDEYNVDYSQVLIDENFNANISVKNCSYGIIREHEGIQGIKVSSCDSNGELLQEDTTGVKMFNQNSCYSSHNCIFNNAGFLGNSHESSKFDNNNPFLSSEKIVLPIGIKRTGMKWKNKTDTYYYRISLVSDLTRRVGYTQATKYNYSIVNSEEQIIEFHIRQAYKTSFSNCYILIERGTQEGTYTHYVLLAVVNNSSYFYEDGLSVNGVKWKTKGNLDFTFENTFNKLTKNLVLNLVESISNNYPKGIGEWQKGDRINQNSYEVGRDTSWVCVTSGKPGIWKSEGKFTE